MKERVLNTTDSVCPVCLARVPASIVAVGEEIFLEKSCATHGPFRVCVWRGSPDYEGWGAAVGGRREKEDTLPPVPDDCPYGCVTCKGHGSNPCSVLLEITDRCNVSCAYCFADSRQSTGPDPDLPTIVSWYGRIADLKTPCNIQLSGGEPTLREDLPSIIAMGRRSGFSFIQLNTHGLRLAREPGYAKTLKDAGLSTVFLQFDGTHDGIYRAIRGRAFLEPKLKAIDACGEAGLGVVLVPTLIPGINTDNIGETVRMALKLCPVVRGVHFQPVSHFGRFPQGGRQTPKHITLPEVIRAIEEQTGGLIKETQLRPAAWEHPHCSFHGSFIAMGTGRLIPLAGQSSCCPTGQPVQAGKTVDTMARLWSAPEPCKTPAEGDVQDLDVFLMLARSRSFAISGMAFQDAWNLDLERLRECCIRILSPDGDLVPFCAYNLTSAEGVRPYRDAQRRG